MYILYFNLIKKSEDKYNLIANTKLNCYTIKVFNRLWENCFKRHFIFIEHCIKKGTLLSFLKGNNSCKMYN